MRTLFNPSEAAANSAFPNGSRPGTMKTTSFAMRLSTVGRSPALLAAIHVSTRLRMARSSSVIALPLSRRSWLGVRPAFRWASEPPALGGTFLPPVACSCRPVPRPRQVGFLRWCQLVLSERRVTLHSGDMGYTIGLFAGEQKCPGRSVTSWMNGSTLVPGEGFEPPTNGLQNRCSTPELTRLPLGYLPARVQASKSASYRVSAGGTKAPESAKSNQHR